jgi:hypothetical protein
MKESSSPFFAFCAVIVRDEKLGAVTSSLDGLVAQLNKPAFHVLHWSRNIKDHTDRKLAATIMAQLPVRLIYVVAPKNAIRADSALAHSTEYYYNYLAKFVLERVGRFTRAIARKDDRPDLKCKVTFGQVKGFNPNVLRSYIGHLRRTTTDDSWRYLTPNIDVAGQGTARPLQWADIGAGALDSAIKPDRHGQYEPEYWRGLVPLLDRHNGRIMGCGLKVLGDDAWLRNLPWWNTAGIT